MNPEESKNPFHGIGRGGVGDPNPYSGRSMPDGQMAEVIFGIVLAMVAFYIVLAKNKPFRIMVMLAAWIGTIFGLVFLVRLAWVFFNVTGVLR